MIKPSITVASSSTPYVYDMLTLYCQTTSVRQYSSKGLPKGWNARKLWIPKDGGNRSIPSSVLRSAYFCASQKHQSFKR
ncbi:hypothetical protein CFP56_008990 [Quercus suber]|uniref:Uncharacterized protein n=1 Tax=Quercus suber TaxID=58331 RepID=A0AAW0L3L3_QUESU